MITYIILGIATIAAILIIISALIASRGEGIRRVITNALFIGLAFALLIHFCLIAIYGEIVISEPNPLILGGEIAFVIGCIIFGFLNIFKD